MKLKCIIKIRSNRVVKFIVCNSSICDYLIILVVEVLFFGKPGEERLRELGFGVQGREAVLGGT